MDRTWLYGAPFFNEALLEEKEYGEGLHISPLFVGYSL